MINNIKYHTEKEALAAIQRNSANYIFCNQKLKEQLSITLSAIKDNPRLLKYIPETLNGNKDIILLALKGLKNVPYDFNLKYIIGHNLLNDQEVGMALLNLKHDYFKILGEGLRNDPKIILKLSTMSNLEWYKLFIGEEFKETVKLVQKEIKRKFKSHPKDVLLHMIKKQDILEERSLLLNLNINTTENKKKKL